MSGHTLKRCPFCGGTASWSVLKTASGDEGNRVVFCGGTCGAEVQGETKADAAQAWNERPIERELLEALDELHSKAVVGTDEERYAALNKAWAAIYRAKAQEKSS